MGRELEMKMSYIGKSCKNVLRLNRYNFRTFEATDVLLAYRVDITDFSMAHFISVPYVLSVRYIQKGVTPKGSKPNYPSAGEFQWLKIYVEEFLSLFFVTLSVAMI